MLILLQTKEKLQLELSQEILPWKIIQEPYVEVLPSSQILEETWLILSFLDYYLTSLITYLIDRLDNVYHNSKEVEKFINLPILGVVPFFNFQTKRYFRYSRNEKNTANNFKQDQNYFIFQETFRNILYFN